MHVYQMRSSNPSVVSTTQERVQVCMDALKEVSKVWLVAKMVHTLFLSIFGNKNLEEKLQKSAGKRHKKPRLEHSQGPVKDEQKTRFDDSGFGYTTGPPAPQVSYERSRPQTPAVTPSRDLGQPAVPMAAPSTTSPNMRNGNDMFLSGNSRGNTRPPTPFNANYGYSVPATPPDLYLVTRNSPPISQSLWENFQPDQLFPESTNMMFPQQFNSSPQNLDPQLSMPSLHTSNMQQQPMPGQQQHLPQRGMRGSGDGAGMQGMGGMGMDGGWPNQMGSEDSWSNSSRGQPIAPTTLNVEDW